MGDIGPARRRYEVLAVPDFGFAEADRWTVPPVTRQMTVPAMTVPSPEPMPVPQPEPVPEPSPIPSDPPSPPSTPDPGPIGPPPGPPSDPGSPTGRALGGDTWLARAARALR